MAASDELVRFGYTAEADGSFVKYKAGRPREKWVPAEGGYERFAREDGQWTQVPYSIHPDWAGVGGLDFATKPQCFLTVYPEDYLAGVYAEGNRDKAARAAETAARKAASA